MLPSLFPFEGSTIPVSFPKKSSLRRKHVVQVEVSNENSSVRERRSETPSPEDMTETVGNGDDDNDEKCEVVWTYFTACSAQYTAVAR